MEWESATTSYGGTNYNVGQQQQQNAPYLEILAQPQGKFRFRYKSEMTGKHGSLLGVYVNEGTTVGNINPNASAGSLNLNLNKMTGVSGQMASANAGQPFGNVDYSTSGGSAGGNFYYNQNVVQSSTTVGTSGGTSSNTFTTSSSSLSSKVFPTVKLHNFEGDGVIRCSLVCESSPFYPHPHLLEMGQSTVGNFPENNESTISPENCFVEIPVSAYNDYTAVFQGLNIIYVSKKDMRRQLQYKMSQLLNYGPDVRRKVPLERLDDISLNINLNVVALYFEAFIPANPSQLICNPAVSTPIQHNKSTQTSELRIVRIDKCSSFCTGDEEVFILVEKVDKHNIQVKFYQESDKGVEIWKAYGKFTKMDVHHQYAIVFKTPPYRSCDIDSEVDVWIQLERPTDSATSTPIPFKYKPLETIRKMPKRQRSRGVGGSDNNPDDASSSRSFQPPNQGGPSGRCSPGGNSEHKNPSGNESDQDQNPSSSGPSNIRQGAASSEFPCDKSVVLGSASEDASQSKSLAMNVALSICQGLHSWAETSDFSLVLQKLRHLLCLVNENGDNALHSAIIHGQVEPFHRILETLSSHADTVSVINEPNLQNLTPITLAVLSGRLDFVQDLIRYNADVSIANSEGDNPIHIAVKENNIAYVKALLNSSTAPVAINKFNYSNMSPLQIAVTNGYNELVELLCYHKVNLAAQEGTFGRTALHLAVEKETKESIISTMILLKNDESDADLVNIQNYRGDTSLHCAANSGSTTLCALLLYHGADPTIENHVRKETDDDEEESSAESDERLSGQTVFDVAANDQVLRILKGTIDDWEIIMKACSPLWPSSPQLVREVKESNIKESEPSRTLDSGIDINSFNSSQFLNSSSSNQL